MDGFRQLTKPNERIIINETLIHLLEPTPWERTITLTKRGGHSAARPWGAPTHRAVMLNVLMHARALPPAPCGQDSSLALCVDEGLRIEDRRRAEAGLRGS